LLVEIRVNKMTCAPLSKPEVTNLSLGL
jgi:hypothetical protein